MSPWAGQPSLPFQGRPPIARHCGHEAAKAAARSRVWFSARYLAWLCEVGMATDHGAAEHFGCEVSTICSTRNALVEQGLVDSFGKQDGPRGKPNTFWRPTEKARRK